MKEFNQEMICQSFLLDYYFHLRADHSFSWLPASILCRLWARETSISMLTSFLQVLIAQQSQSDEPRKGRSVFGTTQEQSRHSLWNFPLVV